MALCTPAHAIADIQVGMGQVAAAEGPQRLRSVLGSCVGVVLYHPRTHRGTLAHVVLPDSAGRSGAGPGKFADTAVPHMVDLLRMAGPLRRELIAKIAGGANMFAHTGPLQIGEANTQAVIRALEAAGVRLVAKDVGGTCGRRITFDCSSGELLLEIASATPRVL